MSRLISKYSHLVFSCALWIDPPISTVTQISSQYIGAKSLFLQITKNLNLHMGLDVRKPVFGVSVKASFKPVSSATETS